MKIDKAAAELKNLQLNFNYAKPVRLIEYMLRISQQDSNSIILDSLQAPDYCSCCSKHEQNRRW